MNQYEVTFIVDPVLSDSEIKATANNYVDHLKNEGCTIVHVDEMGLKQLAYTIKKRNSGFYYTIEFQSETGNFIAKLELALRRDERIIRFLTIKLDKFGIKYNEDKRNGLIKKKERKQKDTKKESRPYNKYKKQGGSAPAAAVTKEAAKKDEPATTEATPEKKEEAPVEQQPVEAVAEKVDAVKETAESTVETAAPTVAEEVTAVAETVAVATEEVVVSEEE